MTGPGMDIYESASCSGDVKDPIYTYRSRQWHLRDALCHMEASAATGLK